MKENNRNKIGKKKSKVIACTFDESVSTQLEEISKGTGATKAAIVRIAVNDYLDDGSMDQLTMLNMIEMIDFWNENRQIVPVEVCKGMDRYLKNMMTIKGGK